MSVNPLSKQHGRMGRVSYATGRQRQRVGRLLDMGDPVAAWAAALSLQRKFPERALRLDVLPSADATWKTPTIEEFELRDYQPNGLAGASAPTPTAPPPLFDMSPQPQYQQYPPLTVSAQQAPSMVEPPSNMDSYGQFLFRQQGHILQETRLKVLHLEGQLQTSQQQQVALKEQLDTANMDLRHKDREHELSLKEARREIRDELEDGMKPAGGGGLGGFLEAASTPGSPLAGILTVLTSKLLGDGAAPPAAPTPAGPAGEMGQVVAGIAELLPDTDTAAKVYAALARILPHPGGLDQLLNLAGIS